MRTIPARAGTTNEHPTADSRVQDDPRAGGDDASVSFVSAFKIGRSPRGRGRPDGPRHGHVGRGTIPARAGTTGRRRCRVK
ncbi:hypothetical protein FRAAL0460 [Frankia alni ACN14a]|uniref:Uncharacterized protein n=1 Tax=Frankia alni (strain DSM 45986 / CECT 9034 / ACN14a) TaxID=326424 RepID=Q0RTG3_FRAAA|nr:hypothetical protein FRAAL0460 [Frankia alni ACN14a]